MNSKFLLTLLIILCLVKYSTQENKAETRSKSEITNKSINSIAFPNYYYGRLPFDWNHDGVIDWRDEWGWNKELNQQLEWNRDWRKATSYGWDEPGKRNWISAPTGSIVSRKLGAKYDTSSNLKNHPAEQNSFSNLREQAIYLPSHDNLGNERFAKDEFIDNYLKFRFFRRSRDGKISSLELYISVHHYKDDFDLEKVKELFHRYGDENDRVTLDDLRKIVKELGI